MATTTSSELASELEAQPRTYGGVGDPDWDLNPSPNATAGEDHDPTFGVDEKKLVRKLDLHLVPLVMLLYTFSFLDRYAFTSPLIGLFQC